MIPESPLHGSRDPFATSTGAGRGSDTDSFRPRPSHEYSRDRFTAHDSAAVDETSQRLKTCSSGQIGCPDGKCILRTQVCDGQADCADASDERSCRERHAHSLCHRILTSFFCCHVFPTCATATHAGVNLVANVMKWNDGQKKRQDAAMGSSRVTASASLKDSDVTASLTVPMPLTSLRAVSSELLYPFQACM